MRQKLICIFYNPAKSKVDYRCGFISPLNMQKNSKPSSFTGRYAKVYGLMWWTKEIQLKTSALLLMLAKVHNKVFSVQLSVLWLTNSKQFSKWKCMKLHFYSEFSFMNDNKNWCIHVCIFLQFHFSLCSLIFGSLQNRGQPSDFTMWL